VSENPGQVNRVGPERREKQQETRTKTTPQLTALFFLLFFGVVFFPAISFSKLRKTPLFTQSAKSKQTHFLLPILDSFSELFFLFPFHLLQIFTVPLIKLEI